MKCRLVIGGVLLVASSVQAITWDFNEDGNAQGWVAQEGAGSTTVLNPTLNSEVQDGIWRISIIPFQVGRNPEVELLSPIIGHDSALFDRMTIRLRVVHTQPITSSFLLKWTNSLNTTYPGSDPAYLESGGCPNSPNCYPRFWRLTPPLVYTTDWQEIAITDLRSGPARWFNGTKYDVLWEGELREIMAYIGLVDYDKPSSADGYAYTVKGPEEVPEAVEIDWIKLTGVEEQLQGELPPPQVVTKVAGSLFSPPVFYPLGVTAVSYQIRGGWPGGLGDLDGDGDLDLVTRWIYKDEGGWVLGFNDGKGAFTRTQINKFPVKGDNLSSFVGGADLDGNGRMDLVLAPSAGGMLPQVWWNDPEKGWVPQELPWLNYQELADVDQDGDVDLWGYLPGTISAQLVFNDGKGHFSAPTSPEASVKGGFVLTTAYPLSPGQQQGLVWIQSYPRDTAGMTITYKKTAGEVEQQFLPATVGLDPRRVMQVGDFDQDGNLDLITNDVSLSRIPNDYYPADGLNFLRNRGDGQMDTVTSVPDVKYNIAFQMADVNGDGIFDVLVPHSDIRNPSVVVLLGQEGGRFVEEGRYPLSEGRGGPILSGDLDGDGDVDLAVFDAYAPGSAGVHVLLNQLAEQKNTAVEDAVSVIPTQSHLGVAYPNPFNPGVVIPFTLGPAAEKVSLIVYNTLGQEVRKLVLGALTAGAHQAEWDGRDETGEVLSSGVYLYRLQAGAWSATGKVVKSQ